jgi:hypothetical protein
MNVSLFSVRPGFAALSAIAPLLILLGGAAQAEPGIAVAAFDYSDTSGEPGDQVAAHAARLKILSETLSQELQKQGRTIVPMSCGTSACSVEATGPENLLAAAKSTSAKYLVYGGVHKMSTLVQWMKVEVVDVATNSLVNSQLLTFRGDTDESYQRAGRFVAKAVVESWREHP